MRRISFCNKEATEKCFAPYAPALVRLRIYLHLDLHILSLWNDENKFVFS